VPTPTTAKQEPPQAAPRVTQADVAQRAGVSISVVSRELNADPALRARPETRRRIHEAVEELGYTPSHAARALRLSRAFAVGLVVPDLTNPIYDPLIRGIEDTADGLGYHVLVGRSERIEPGAEFLRKLAAEGRVDGFLVQRRDEIDLRDFVPLAEAGGRPVVIINSRWSGRGSVVHDDVAGGRIATQHLLHLGHREIALIGGDVHSHTAKAREQGYLQAVHAAGMRKRSAWVVHRPYDPEAGRIALRELCTARRRRPSAVVVANINTAIGVLHGARELGLKVPEQLSVIAIHDWWITDYTRPRLTTVRLPQYQLGQEAMRLLHLRLSGEPAEDLTVSDPPPELMERESTAPPPRRLVRARLQEQA
jgi:LacI family transcriptional regulator